MNSKRFKSRELILHPYGRGFTEAMESELELRGLRFVHLDLHSPDHDLDHGLACVVWFYHALRAPLEVWNLKRRLAKHGVPLITWNRDAPHYLNRTRWRLWALDRWQLFDIYATHTLADTRHSFAPKLIYLPNAADPSRYAAGRDPALTLKHLRNFDAYQVDVSFFGGMDGARYKEDRARQEFFSELAKRLDGLAISHDFRQADDMDLDQQVEFIQTSRINLNFGARCEYGHATASGLPERCYGIPACGGFLLCDRRTHARDDFTVGENWAEFDGLDDCVTQIRYWLAHFDAARDLAEKCHHHVLAHHTYAHRAATLHQALLDWHRRRENNR